jgi:hypothetical protein
LAVALGAAFLLFGMVWAAGYCLDLIDEGYFYELGARVRAGALPYRDFETYYTPGVFYLHALIFGLGGENVLTARLALALVRTAGAVGAYLLARPLAPPPLALLAPLTVLAVDPVPLLWEPHPGWYAYLPLLGVIGGVADHLERHRHRSLLLAGVAAGVAFAFKQNTGAFLLLAAGAFLALWEYPKGAPWPVGAARGALVAGVCLALTGLIWPALSPLYVMVFLLPLYALGTFLLLEGRRAGGVAVPWRDAMRHWALLGGGFGLVTLLWLAPTAAALGWANIPIGLFAGGVNRIPLFYALALPTPGVRVALALVALPLLVWLAKQLNAKAAPSEPGPTPQTAGEPAACPGPTTGTEVGLQTASSRFPLGQGFRRLGAWSRVLPLAALILGAVWLLPTEEWRSDLGVGLLDGTVRRFATLFLYLPALIFWPALAALVWRARRAGPGLDGRWRWYLFAGAILAFAQYPRTDEIHLLQVAPAILISGCALAAQAWRALRGRGERLLLVTGLAGVPLLAVAPHVGLRAYYLTTPDFPAAYAPLRLERAPVRLVAREAQSVRGVVEYLVARTQPGEPIFVYPVAPMFYFLADRPNPTRFSHLQPGVADVAAQREIIRQLDRVRLIVWDGAGVTDWKTDPANRVLSDYIWACFVPRADFPPFLVMERFGCAITSGE